METTKSERITWRKEAKDPKTEFTHEERHGILNLVDDADRLATIERQVRELADKYAEDIGDADNLTIARELRAILDPEGI